MTRAAYERLSGLDQSFLHFETPHCYMHVAITAIFEAGSLLRPDGGLDIKRVRRHIASRLRLIPRYRQRLGYIPVVNDPVWVDDDQFDLDYHVRHTHLPRPGTERQLQTLAARILERPLDRQKPLWETWLIEGLPGHRFAMVSKVHHCMVDGVAGVDLMAALLGFAPCEQPEKPERWTPRPAPSPRQLLRDDLLRRARASVDLVRRLPGVLEHPGEAGADLGERLSAFWGLLRSLPAAAAETPFNRPIGPHRRIDWLRFELSEVKAVKDRLGGSLNDVVLATVAGAVRRFLRRRRVDVDGIDFRAVVPVNMRSRGEHGRPGNRVSIWFTPLPVSEKEAAERFRIIQATTSACKRSHSARGAEVLTDTAEWTTSHVLGLAVRLVNRTRPYNLIVTNVPGPPVPFYLLDAPMVAAYPHVPLFENQGLGIALFSYAGSLYWGLAGDWDLVPDIHQLVDGLRHSFEELRDAAGLRTEEAPLNGATAAAERPAAIQLTRRPRLAAH
jgi:WS/DGAT/MGAT family acyltransferase